MYETLDDAMGVVTSLGEVASERSLTEDEVAQYEAAEAAVRSFQRTEQIRQRAANLTAISPAAVHVAPAVEDDTLERAFTDYLRTGQASADMAELRAQSTTTGTAGGYLVPTTFLNRMTETMKAFGGVANVAENLSTSSGGPVQWLSADDTGNLGTRGTEGAAPTSGADATFGKRVLGAYKYTSAGPSGTPVRISAELIQDASFDVQGYVSRILGRRIARKQAPDLVSGTGVEQPLGLLTGRTGVEMSSGGPTYDDLIDFIHSIDPAYRESGCRWVFNDTSLKVIRKLKDSHGDPIWRSITDSMGTPLPGGVLLGYPVTIDQACGNIVSSNGADDNWGAFGNIFEGYVVRRVGGVVVNVNPYSRMNEGEIEFSAWARMDATQNDTSAYVALAGYTA